MRINFSIKEAKFEEIKMEGVETSVEYSTEEMLESIKTMREFLGKDGVKTILEALLRNEEEQRKERREERQLERERIRSRSEKRIIEKR